MEFIYEMIAVFEIILMNLHIFKKNIRCRYPRYISLPILILYTILLVFLGVMGIRALGIYGNGNGVFTIFGFFYLLPLHYLYEGSSRKHFFLMCFAWIYTLSVFIISVQIGSFFTSYMPLAFNVMILQALVFLATYKLINLFLNRVYIELMKCQDEGIQRKLNMTSLLWFLGMFFVNLHFIFDNSHLLKVIAVVALLINAFYNFVLLYDILMKRDQIGTLQTEIIKDALTGLGNRIAFDRALENMIKEDKPFYFLYLDLDEFKKINDAYGHLVGDKYLKEFAGRIQEINKSHLTFRISGDEFAMIVVAKDIKKTLDSIMRIDFILPATRTCFRGVSIGYSHYPKDSRTQDHLIYLADQRMYEAKTKKKQPSTH